MRQLDVAAGHSFSPNMMEAESNKQTHLAYLFEHQKI